jgi:hypothetical protein
MNIQKEDVIHVASLLGAVLSEDHIQKVLEAYPSAQDEDPSGSWLLVVEKCIDDTQPPKKKYLITYKSDMYIEANSLEHARNMFEEMYWYELADLSTNHRIDSISEK